MSPDLSTRAKKAGKIIWKETVESVLFILWLCTPPFPPKIFSNFMPDEFNLHSTRINLNKLYRKGFISKIRHKGNIFFKLKKHPKELFWSETQLLKEKKYEHKWDKKWWILIYDIPEKIKFKRESLRFYIKSLGFGKLQESCWISPYDFSSQLHVFCRQKGILQHIYLYNALFFSGKDISRAVNEIWNLLKLKERYEAIITKVTEEIEEIKAEDVALKLSLRNYTKLYREYKDIINNDPFLPKEFVKNWPRHKAEVLINKLSDLLSKKILLQL